MRRVASLSSASVGARLAALVASAACCPVFGAAPVPLADVPVTVLDARAFVTVNFPNAGDVPCVLDTGSNIGIVRPQWAKKSDVGAVVKVAFASGAVSMPQVSIRDVAVGGARRMYTVFFVRDRDLFDESKPMPCVLGSSFFDHFTVDLDMPAQRLRLYAGGTRIDEVVSTANPKTHLDVINGAGDIRTKLVLNGVPANGRLDSGSACSAANSSLLDALKERKDGGKEWVVRLGNLAPAALTPCADDALHGVMRREHAPYVHIGMDLLGRYRVLLDHAHRDVALVPPETAR